MQYFTDDSVKVHCKPKFLWLRTIGWYLDSLVYEKVMILVIFANCGTLRSN